MAYFFGGGGPRDYIEIVIANTKRDIVLRDVSNCFYDRKFPRTTV